MRILTLAFAAAFALSFLTIQAEPAQAVGVCAYNDVYNNMGGPGSECEGVVCMGYSGGDWQTCVPPHPCEVYSCPPPPLEPIVTGSTASSTTSLCLLGDAYNNQAGQPSAGCDGAVCTGYSNGDWGTCVLDCTADGCPRFFEDPCSRLMCQPPFEP